jgi:hypothetical protein
MRLWVLLFGVFLFSGGVCRLGLAYQFVRSLPIASREVKWNEAGDARSFGDIPRLAAVKCHLSAAILASVSRNGASMKS